MQGICLWPFFPLSKPKGNSELNSLCSHKRAGEGQSAVKIQRESPLKGISALQGLSLKLISGVCSIQQEARSLLRAAANEYLFALLAV